MVNKLTEVECLVLCLLEGQGSYSEIYGEVMEVLTTFTSDNDFYCVKKGEFESWHKWRKDKAEIGGKQYDVEIWYYKKRLMVKFRTACRDSPLDELIEEAKKNQRRRGKLERNQTPDQQTDRTRNRKQGV